MRSPEARLARLAGLTAPHVVLATIAAQAYDTAAFKCAADDLLLSHKVDIRFHTLAVGVVMASRTRIKALLIEDKSGRGAVLARTFIDCSGDGDLAVFAGAAFEKGDEHGNTLYPTMMFRVNNVDAAAAGEAWRSIPALMDEAEKRGVKFPRKGAIVRPMKHTAEWRVNVTQVKNASGRAVDATDAVELSGGEIEGRRQAIEFFEFLRCEAPGFADAYVVDIPPQLGVRETRRINGRYQLTADDVLTPRVDVVFVHAGDPAVAVIDAALESGFSRFPVIGQDADDVLGLVHLKRVVAVPPEQRAAVPVRALMVPAPVVPGTLPLDDTLALLRGRGLQMAVVADEYGGTAGVVTLEDVVEELVGEIADEHDPRAGRAVQGPDGTWLLSGSLRPDEIADLTGLHLPESGDYETVAGLVLDLLNRLPEVGDTLLVPAALAAHAALGSLPGDEPVPALDNADDTDVPRPVTARITARLLDGRRLAQVQLSAAGTRTGADDE